MGIGQNKHVEDKEPKKCHKKHVYTESHTFAHTGIP